MPIENNNAHVQQAVEQSAHQIAREIRVLIRATSPSNTKQRRLLQAKLRLVTSTWGRPPLDMKKFTSDLYKGQKSFRTTGLAVRRLQAKHERSKYRIRGRLPLAHQGKVIDTRKDTKGNLYFEAANGQALSATRITGTRLVEEEKILKPGRINHAVRRRIVAPLGNPVLVDIVKRELALNATRA